MNAEGHTKKAGDIGDSLDRLLPDPGVNMWLLLLN